MTYKRLSFFLYLVLGFYFVSCRSGKTVQTTQATTDNLSLFSMGPFQEGVDFTASGSNPTSWTIVMDFDKGYFFKSISGAKYVTSAVKPTLDAARGTMTFDVQSTDGPMQINLFTDKCPDKGKQVTVAVKDRLYQGCGDYMIQKGLSGKWYVYQFDESPVLHTDYPKGVPYLQITPGQEVIKIFDGCSTFNGTMTMQGDRIRFSAYTGTWRDCPEMKPAAFLKTGLEGQLVNYRFSPDTLQISLANDSRILLYKP